MDSPVTGEVGAGRLLVSLVCDNPRVARTAVNDDTLFAFEAALLNKVGAALLWWGKGVQGWEAHVGLSVCGVSELCSSVGREAGAADQPCPVCLVDIRCSRSDTVLMPCPLLLCRCLQKDSGVLDTLRHLCAGSTSSSTRLQNGVARLLFAKNADTLVMPLRTRRRKVQVMPTPEYFVAGTVRRWVDLAEFVALCDGPYFRYDH